MFVKNLFLFQSKLAANGVKSIVISGLMFQWERDESIEQFENGDIDVLITNPHTLAESISLHKICHYAIYLEYSFNLTHMLQSRDRIHRLGITEEERPHYIYMFLNGNDCEFKNLYYGLEPMLASDFASYIEQGSSAKLNDNILSLLDDNFKS